MRTSFWQWARARERARAIVTHDGEPVAAGALLANANRLVHALRARGLLPGEVLATILGSRVELFECYLAAMQAGWYLVPLSPSLCSPELAHILGDAGARVLIADAAVAARAHQAADAVGLAPALRFFVGGDDPAALARLTAGQPSATPPARIAGQVMPYTSGTTGRPKGVRRPISGRDPDEAAAGLSRLLDLFDADADAGGVHLAGAALYHSASLMFAAASLHRGHTVVLADRWSPAAFLATVERQRVSSTALVPTQLHQLVALPDDVRRGHDLGSLRCVVHAAAPCAVELKRRVIDWWGPIVYEYYAASEDGGTVVSTEATP